MAAVGVRTRPLIAVLSRVPLFIEGVSAAFKGIADVQAISLEDVEAHSLIRAFRPDAVIAEGADAERIGASTPCVRVDVEVQQLWLREGADWLLLDVDLSPEAIRNAVIGLLYGGDVT